MPTVDLEKTSYKFKDVLWVIGVLATLSGGVYRFESRMNKLDDNVASLEQKMMYKYELEILKINSRIDLIEAKSYALRKDFKNDSTSKELSFNLIARTNRKRDSHKRLPQVCMVIPRQPECQRKKFNIRKLIA